MIGFIATLIVGIALGSIATSVALCIKAGHALRKQEKTNVYRQT